MVHSDGPIVGPTIRFAQCALCALDHIYVYMFVHIYMCIYIGFGSLDGDLVSMSVWGVSITKQQKEKREKKEMMSLFPSRGTLPTIW